MDSVHGGLSVGAPQKRKQEHLLRVAIHDTGPGLTSEQEQKLFAAFSQADATVTRKHGGSGLGLIISRRLSQLMGGAVELTSTKPDQGSVFTVTVRMGAIPGVGETSVLARQDTLSVATPRGNAGRLSGRILLAEDGPDNQRLISFHLRRAGAEVKIAENGRMALDMLDQAEIEGQPFDLLLTDMQMPELDGYSLARMLRERGSTLPIVALTAHAMAEDQKKCLDAGCNDYATKPIDKSQLTAICGRWIATRCSTHT